MAHTRHVAVALLLACGHAATEPVIKIQLTKENVPVYRHGVVKSHKAAYHGEVSIGNPPQRFVTIFDTGSAQVILPAEECQEQTCQKHRRLDANASGTAAHINEDGSEATDHRIMYGADRDMTRIRFGTGEVDGAYVRDTVCLNTALNETDDERPDCAEMRVIAAYYMSDEPFWFFGYDGVIGLSLESLALTPEFSFFHVLSQGFPEGAPAHFSVYLARHDDVKSEIAFGGANTDHMDGPIHWSPVTNEEMGHWQIPIRNVTVNGQLMEQCADGECLAIVDTGCTALGVPREVRQWMFNNLALVMPGERPDSRCKDFPAPAIDFDMGDYTLSMDNNDFFKKNPLLVDGHMRPIIDGVTQASNEVAGHESSADEAPPPKPLPELTTEEERDAAWEARALERHTVCQPSLLSVPNAAPLKQGKVFIFGEPVLRKYYTTFDWKELQVGFALAKHLELPPSTPTPEEAVAAPEQGAINI